MWLPMEWHSVSNGSYSSRATLLTYRRGVHDINVYIDDRGQTSSFERFRTAISRQRVIRSTPCFVLRYGFRGRRIEWRYLWLDQIHDGGRPPSWKVSKGHISATGHLIHFTFGSRTGVFGVGGSNGPNPDWIKSLMAAGRHLRKFRIAISLQRFVDQLRIWF